jgi:SAM-dependent methyltransferase
VTLPAVGSCRGVVYLGAVADGAGSRIYGRVFDAIADEYDRHRPAYPDALVGWACGSAGLGPGEPVLEVGCGTGQLTRSLLARGLRVTAIEPGENLIARAQIGLQGAGDVRFVNARLEQAPVPRSRYRGVFSASAIHWVDPDVSWQKLADALTDGGTLALLSYFGVQDPYSEEDQQALRAVLAGIAPEIEADWPTYRDLHAMIAGASERRANVSKVWAWLGGYDIARSEAAQLFDDVQLAVLPRRSEHTAAGVNALLATMSFWTRLSPGQRDTLVAENEAIYRRLGRPIRSSTMACLVSARRRPRGDVSAVTGSAA